jgi:hypothetical protein
MQRNPVRFQLFKVVRNVGGVQNATLL